MFEKEKVKKKKKFSNYHSSFVINKHLYRGENGIINSKWCSQPILLQSCDVFLSEYTQVSFHIIYMFYSYIKTSYMKISISILEKRQLKTKWIYLCRTYSYLPHLLPYPDSFALYFGAALQKYPRTYILWWCGSGLIFSCWRRPAI